MKQIITSLFFLLLSTTADAQNTFVRGADASWCTEMEASGRKFYNADGQETELFALLKQIGMNAVRLRVWVNPEGYGYGAWCDKDDVLKKAERAQQQGLDVMIDFHYSDFFADPGRQEKPKDWSDYTTAQLKTAIADHTKEILTALKEKGIEPKWVLSNAAYDAVKEVLPDAYVIVHIANAYQAAEHDGWFYKEFKEAGGKFDMIGLSHYPDPIYWNNTTKSDVASNTNAANSVKTLGDLFNVPVMIVETGFPQQDVETGSQVMTDLFNKMKPLTHCAGIFYWEPEVDGVWKPDYYNKVGWGAYDMGAFTTDGKPTAILAAFNDGSTGIHTVPTTQSDTPAQWFDLMGRQQSAPTKGLYIMKKGQETRKVLLP